MTSPGLTAFKLAFELSPIMLTGGVAENLPFQMIPIIALTEAVDFTAGLLQSGSSRNMDDYFAHFLPIPGSSLIDNQYGMYPFANQSVAANASITNPLSVSMLMICPAKPDAGYAVKLATMSLLQATLSQHVSSGGTFTVVTPAYIYTDCLLQKLYDVSSGRGKQVQMEYRWDFFRPLLTLQQAQQAQNNMMSKITAGVPTTGDLSGAASSLGLSPFPGSAGLIPASGSQQGGAVAGNLPFAP